MPQFDPQEFVPVAKRLLTDTSLREDARKRSAANRAYYAVYGYLVVRICQAKDRSRQELFGSSGHHGELLGELRYPAFKKVQEGFSTLLRKRAHADYKYEQDFTSEDVQSLIDTAESTLRKLQSIQEPFYEKLTLPWW